MAYELPRNTKGQTYPSGCPKSPKSPQREVANADRFKIVQEYNELKKKALDANEYQKSIRALNQLVKHLKIFEHYRASPLLVAIEKNPEDLEELVDQFLWINTSLGNWSYVLRALEMKVKLAGKEKG